MRRSILLAAAFAPVFALAQTGTNFSCATAIELEVAPTNMQLSLLPMYGLWFTNAVPVARMEGGFVLGDGAL